MLELLEVRGLLSVQDQGRWGLQGRGVFPAGALDPWAAELANALLGNPPSAAVLEGVGGGFCAQVRMGMTVTLAGPPRAAWVDGRPLAFYHPTNLEPGMAIAVGDGPGQHYYVAVAGGWWARPWAGSRSEAVTMTEAGWFRPRRRGAVVLMARPGWVLPLLPALERRHWPTYPQPARLRVWPGPDYAKMGEALAQVLTKPLTVRRWSRMGVAAAGAPLYRRPWSMSSRPTVPGVIEVDAAGNYLILGPERQTTGGYPMPFVVDPLDFGLLAELQPGAVFWLDLIADQAAMAAERRARQALVAAVRRRAQREIGDGCRMGSHAAGAIDTRKEGDGDG
ncbi:MAG: biotin-dependent carboxyltransferase family protein [Firmicutes bacterium]|nr:hypothetical protein [Alicyclobacillaceae bacterium]MCL6497512.1 biotin-dependent carboxyltransferase family protein [Bacillota bacterium]